MENRIMETSVSTEQDKQIVEDFAKLEDAEKVFFFEILKALAAGDGLESTLIHQPNEYKKMLDTMDTGKLFYAAPLMHYMQARGEGWGDTLTLAMAYQAGIADGKRLDRARRAAGKKVPA